METTPPDATDEPGPESAGPSDAVRAPSTEALDRLEAELATLEAELATLEADDGGYG